MTVRVQQRIRLGFVLTLSLIGFLATDCGAAEPKVCTLPIEGEWTIVSFTQDPVSAVSYQDAQKKVGKKVVISKSAVTFPPDSCRVSRVSREFVSARELSLFPDEASHPLNISFDCFDNVFIPSFDIGKSCKYIRSGLDGISYKLRRDK